MKSILILGGHDHKPNARGEEEMVLSTNCANNLLTDDVGSWWFGNHCHCCEPMENALRRVCRDRHRAHLLVVRDR